MKMYYAWNRIYSSELIHYITSLYIHIHIQERKTANILVICITIIKKAILRKLMYRNKFNNGYSHNNLFLSLNEISI